mmetsp:Transcript_79432/g.155426  ORF Transcript_79432/g.155426 Transcript_79432/m.155426 type:complete len:383 (+) Transcript_79432:120-1268(+)
MVTLGRRNATPNRVQFVSWVALGLLFLVIHFLKTTTPCANPFSPSRLGRSRAVARGLGHLSESRLRVTRHTVLLWGLPIVPQDAWAFRHVVEPRRGVPLFRFFCFLGRRGLVFSRLPPLLGLLHHLKARAPNRGQGVFAVFAVVVGAVERFGRHHAEAHPFRFLPRPHFLLQRVHDFGDGLDELRHPLLDLQLLRRVAPLEALLVLLQGLELPPRAHGFVVPRHEFEQRLHGLEPLLKGQDLGIVQLEQSVRELGFVGDCHGGEAAALLLRGRGVRPQALHVSTLVGDELHHLGSLEGLETCKLLLAHADRLFTQPTREAVLKRRLLFLADVEKLPELGNLLSHLHQVVAALVSNDAKLRVPSLEDGEVRCSEAHARWGGEN